MKKVIILCIFMCAFVTVSAFAQQNKVVVVPLSSSSKTQKTIITYNGIVTDNTISFTNELARTLGTFTKSKDNTDIKLFWRTQVEQIGSADSFGNYEIRLSGVAGDGGENSGPVIYNTAPTSRESIDYWDYWTGLPAGDYNVEVWIRGNVTSIELNNGNFPRIVLIEEVITNTAPTPAPLQLALPADEQGCSAGVGPDC